LIFCLRHERDTQATIALLSGVCQSQAGGVLSKLFSESSWFGVGTEATLARSENRATAELVFITVLRQSSYLFIYLNSSQLNAALHIIQWMNSAGATTVRCQGKALTDT